MRRITWSLLCPALIVALLPLSGCQQPVDAIWTSFPSGVLDFGFDATPRNVQVRNQSTALNPMELSVRARESWISVDRSSLVVPAPNRPGELSDPVTFQVTINRGLLPRGQHEGFIDLTAPGANRVRLLVRVNQLEDGGGRSLRITDPVVRYSKPFLIDFNYSLRDEQNQTVVAEPSQFTVTAMEDGIPVTSDVEVLLKRAAARQLLGFLVLDYTLTMQQTPGAIDRMEQAVETVFLPALNEDAFVGAYGFHREDPAEPPRLLSDFTANRASLVDAIRAYSEETRGFASFSRMYDAVDAALDHFQGGDRTREERFIVLFSDGFDNASSRTRDDIRNRARALNVRIFTIAVGAAVNFTDLAYIATETRGAFFESDTLEGFTANFGRIIDELESHYQVRWSTARRGSQNIVPEFSLVYGQNQVSYRSREPFRPNAHEGDVLRGVLRFAQSESPDKTTLFLRAEFFPRQIQQLRVFVRSEFDYGVSRVDASGDSAVAGWSLARAPKDDGEEIILTSPGPPARYGEFGPLLRFDFDFDIDPEMQLFDKVCVDNSIYPLQSFIIEGFEDVCP